MRECRIYALVAVNIRWQLINHRQLNVHQCSRAAVVIRDLRNRIAALRDLVFTLEHVARGRIEQNAVRAPILGFLFFIFGNERDLGTEIHTHFFYRIGKIIEVKRTICASVRNNDQVELTADELVQGKVFKISSILQQYTRNGFPEARSYDLGSETGNKKIRTESRYIFSRVHRPIAQTKVQ